MNARKAAYVVSARPLGWGQMSIPSASAIVVAGSVDDAVEQAKRRFDPDWQYAEPGEEQQYRNGRGENTPNKMWLTVWPVDWETKFSPAGTLREFARAFNEVHS